MSSGRAPAAIAVIRISGPDAQAAAAALAGSLPPPRRAATRTLRAADGELLDRGLVIVFPGPNSATGEDIVELHCHGGRAVVEAVERALHAMPSVRRAEPGEFTRRALANGRIDLTEAAGLADLLEAETQAQRRRALAAVEGQVSRAIRGWMERMAGLSAQIEASIDYGEEGDVERERASLERVTEDMLGLAADMAIVLDAPPVERWRDGLRVVVAGPPNAGKSTLINLLGARDAAIVSPVAGTTRDRIEVVVRRGDHGYVLIDTAGLRDDPGDAVEQAGILRTREAMAGADLILWLSDDVPPVDGVGELIRVHGKADIPGRSEKPAGAALAISSVDPDSIDRLWQVIDHHADRQSASVLPLHDHERSACRRAWSMIAAPSPDSLLLAEDLRRASQALAAALGINATEEMFDALFSRFCVGK